MRANYESLATVSRLLCDPLAMSVASCRKTVAVQWDRGFTAKRSNTLVAFAYSDTFKHTYCICLQRNIQTHLLHLLTAKHSNTLVAFAYSETFKLTFCICLQRYIQTHLLHLLTAKHSNTLVAFAYSDTLKHTCYICLQRYIQTHLA